MALSCELHLSCQLSGLRSQVTGHRSQSLTRRCRSSLVACLRLLGTLVGAVVGKRGSGASLRLRVGCSFFVKDPTLAGALVLYIYLGLLGS